MLVGIWHLCYLYHFSFLQKESITTSTWTFFISCWTFSISIFSNFTCSKYFLKEKEFSSFEFRCFLVSKCKVFFRPQVFSRWNIYPWDSCHIDQNIFSRFLRSAVLFWLWYLNICLKNIMFKKWLKKVLVYCLNALFIGSGTWN